MENWQAVLLVAGQRHSPGSHPDAIVFHRVHAAIEEVSPLHDLATKHFVLARTDDHDRTRTVVFAVFAGDITREDGAAAVEIIDAPLLLIGRPSGQSCPNDRAVTLDLDAVDQSRLMHPVCSD